MGSFPVIPRPTLHVCVVICVLGLLSPTNLTVSAGRLVSSVVNRKCRQVRTEMHRILAQQTARNNELSRRIVEQDHIIADLNRRVVEYDQRFDEIVAEITRVRAAGSVQVKQTTKETGAKRTNKKSSKPMVATCSDDSKQLRKRPIVEESDMNENAKKRVNETVHKQPFQRCLRSNTKISA